MAKTPDTVASLVKRGSPSAWPHELEVVDDPTDPFFDDRNELPVSDERIRNFVLVGQVQPISVKLRGGRLLVNAGRQRWKRATIINHVAGHRAYAGKLQSVLDAIKRIRGTDLETLIADRCSAGMKLQFTLYRGDEKEAAGASMSENEQRDEDPLINKIKRAQRLAKHGHTAQDIADYCGVSEQTAKKWLGRDLSAPPATRKPRAKSTKPSKSVVNDVVIALGDPKVGTLLCWVRGESTTEQVLEFYPELAEALGVEARKVA
jgi:Homeodomain-like domain-containing protein